MIYTKRHLENIAITMLTLTHGNLSDESWIYSTLLHIKYPVQSIDNHKVKYPNIKDHPQTTTLVESYENIVFKNLNLALFLSCFK